MTSTNWSRALVEALAAEIAHRAGTGPAVQAGNDNGLALMLRDVGVELVRVAPDADVPADATAIVLPGTLQDADSATLAGFARENRTLIVLERNPLHGSRRLELLLGRTVAPSSLALSAVAAILRQAGYGDMTAAATLVDPLEGVEGDAEIPGTVVEWLRGRADALEAEYLVVARPGPAADAPLSARPLNDYAPVNDAHAERLRLAKHEEYVRERREALLAKAEADRYDLLTLRDHAVGAEGASASAVRSAKEAEAIAQAILSQPRGARRYASTLLNTVTGQSPLATAKWAASKAGNLAKRVRNA